MVRQYLVLFGGGCSGFLLSIWSVIVPLLQFDGLNDAIAAGFTVTTSWVCGLPLGVWVFCITCCLVSLVIRCTAIPYL
jgi:hypothetical protein